MLPKAFFVTLLIVIFAFAWWRGRSEEKVAATTCVLAVIATRILISPPDVRYADVEIGLLWIDAAMLATFVAIALYSNRFWPLWAAGFQLTVSMSHGLKAIELDLLPRAYAAAAVFWSYPILLVILVGTWRSHRRRIAEARVAASA